ncbi:hypothetical protein LZ31DRAFT_365121 [Colletotrichum somersetense]|nr:hypothetical protein LZ31DRAFT_365121 [Colletotrichum somersetense]
MLKRGNIRNQSYHLTLGAGLVNQNRKGAPPLSTHPSWASKKRPPLLPNRFCAGGGGRKEKKKKETSRSHLRTTLVLSTEADCQAAPMPLATRQAIFPGLVRQVSSCAGQFSVFNHCSFSFPHTPLLLILFIPHIFTPMTTEPPPSLKSYP